MKEEKTLTDEDIRKAVLEQIVEILDDYWIAVKNGNLHWDKEDEFWFFDSLKGLIHKSIDLAIAESRKSTLSEVVKKIEKRKDELCLLFDKNDDRLQKDNFKTDMAREFVESTQEAIGTRLDELNKLKKALCSQKPELESEKEVNSASLSCIAASAGEKQGADRCFKYKCGHSSTAILMDNNLLSYVAYLEWSRWLRYIRIGGR